MADVKSTFIVDCTACKAKVAASEDGRAERTAYDDDSGQPYAWRVYVGLCPKKLNGPESRLALPCRRYPTEIGRRSDSLATASGWHDMCRRDPLLFGHIHL
jgi:hypothetical protein